MTEDVLDGFINDACKRWDVTWEQIIGKTKPPPVVRAREDVAVELRSLGWSYPLIGALLLKHHTAILLMVRRAAKRGAGSNP